MDDCRDRDGFRSSRTLVENTDGLSVVVVEVDNDQGAVEDGRNRSRKDTNCCSSHWKGIVEDTALVSRPLCTFLLSAH